MMKFREILVACSIAILSTCSTQPAYALEIKPNHQEIFDDVVELSAGGMICKFDINPNLRKDMWNLVTSLGYPEDQIEQHIMVQLTTTIAMLPYIGYTVENFCDHLYRDLVKKYGEQ